MSLVVEGTVARGTFSRSISLRVEPGRPIGLVGPNGSGKSTILRAIAGLDRLASGSMMIDDRVLDDATRFVPAEERGIGVVFQDLRLFAHLNARDNVAFGLRCAGWSRAASRTRAENVLGRVGAINVADRRPGSFSGGEAQRVALARAIAVSPAVLLLDEPFAAVDASSRPGLRSLLREITFGTDVRTVIVSHDAADLAELATDIVDLSPLW